MGEPKKKLLVAGIVTSVEYQKCKLFVSRLVKGFPNEFEAPVLRPMLDVEWNEYLWKIRRNIGGKVWTLQKNAVVLLNNEFLGDDAAVFKYVSKRARIRISEDFHCLGVFELIDIFDKQIANKRKFAYIAISIHGRFVGSMLFLLYADHVPITVNMFLKRCKSRNSGWSRRPVHRVVKGSWIQLGGFDLDDKQMPCENYVVPHDRRGVISTCHQSKHVKNTTQVVISLAPTPWMDCKYVAFGQLLQGDDVLKQIEAVDTNYEDPKKPIIVWQCDEFTLDTTPDLKTQERVETFLKTINPFTGQIMDVVDVRDVPSDLSVTRYKQGLYCHELDLQPHPALNKWHLYYEGIYGRQRQEQLGEFDTAMDDYHRNLQRMGLRVKTDSDNDSGDDVGLLDVDIQKRLHQLLSSETVNFQQGVQPLREISFEKVQKLDPTHTKPQVAKIVAATERANALFRARRAGKTDDN